MVGRQDGGAGRRLAVHQLQVVRGLLQGLRGRVHRGRAQHTAGHGVRDAQQRAAHHRPVHGHRAGARVQSAGHVQARVDGLVFGGVPDVRQGGQHVRERRCRRRPRDGGPDDHRRRRARRHPGRGGHRVPTAPRDSRRYGVHGRRGGHRRHAHGRPHTDTHVRVPPGRGVHHTVRDAGQRLHRRRGHTRGHVPDERAARRHHEQSQRHVPDRAHLLRHRQPRERRQPGHRGRLLRHRHAAAVLQPVPEGVRQQAVVHTRAHRARHHRHRHGAVPVHHVFRRLQNQIGESV